MTRRFAILWFYLMLLELCQCNKMFSAIMSYAKEDSPNKVHKQCVFVVPYNKRIPYNAPTIKEMMKVHAIPQPYQCNQSTPNPNFINKSAIYMDPKSSCFANQYDMASAYGANFIISTVASEKTFIEDADFKELPVVLLFEKDVEKLEKNVGSVTQWNGTWQMAIYHLYLTKRDSSSYAHLPSLVLALIAVLTITCGSFLGALYDRDHEFVNPLANAPEFSSWMMWLYVAVMLTFLVSYLLLLYFFPNYMVWPALVLAYVTFTYTSHHFLYDIILRSCRFSKERFRYYFSRPILGLTHANCLRLSLLVPIIGLVIFCFVIRHSPKAFLLLDLFGASACIVFIKKVGFPNLKFIALVFVALFCYDIFMVFITPLMMKGGGGAGPPSHSLNSYASQEILERTRRSLAEGHSNGAYDPLVLLNKYDRKRSVMEAVAIGGTEQLPMTFKVPHYNVFADPYENDDTFCLELYRYCAFLGFGDVVVPGFLGHFAWSFDMMNNWIFPRYFTIFIIGYIAGLVFTNVGIILMNGSAQPALLYLVPCTLLPIIVMALYRKDLKLLWNGPFCVNTDLTDSLTANVTELPERSNKEAEAGDALNAVEQ